MAGFYQTSSLFPMPSASSDATPKLPPPAPPRARPILLDMAADRGANAAEGGRWWSGPASEGTQDQVTSWPRQGHESAATPRESSAQLAQSGSAGAAWVSPTGGGVRGQDNSGTGQFGVSRDGGRRSHEGLDFVGKPGQDVRAITDGVVTKLGYPYDNDLSYRYVEIETSNGYHVRQHYIAPSKGLKIGSRVSAGQVIGTQQSIDRRYRGITEHVHVEVWPKAKQKQKGMAIDPAPFFSRP